ncbi:hypothetical protein HGRIS_007296 [Hohenbuehelia grisea]|uniref:Survival Motor Neuron Gemin2-binding domain-containing protein n=1 Tax=Hohenbuehelia grisea TaxID=104357 RepID=A0ABR3J4B9_9AGAR
MSLPQRQVVSYDDISLPYDPEPPSKKRRKQPQTNTNPATVRHWDDPSSSGASPPQEDPEAEEESRQLTNNEIWDDSALIDAWDAANEEYEAFHGPGKDWKTERVHKSPMWYNVPPKSTLKSSSTAAPTNGVAPDFQALDNGMNGAEDDSTPLDFNAFVPSHDASLGLPLLPDPSAAPDSQSASNTLVSQDDAFSRATSAMYWAGYWTAMYHCQRHYNPPNDQPGGENEGEEEDGEEDADMISTQR